MVRTKHYLLAVLISGCVASAAQAQFQGGPSAAAGPGSSPPGAIPPPPAALPPPSLASDFLPDFEHAADDLSSPHLIVNVGGLFLQRSTTPSRPLLYDPNAGVTLQDPSTMSFSMNAGPRLDALWETPSGLALELVYFDVDNWQSKVSFPNAVFSAGVGNLTIDDALAIPVTEADVLYSSKLYSGEIDLRYTRDCSRLTSLIGFRWMEFDDAYLTSGQNLTGLFSHLVQARNEMYGLQIGVDAEAFSREIPLQLGVVVKAGLYANAVAQNNGYNDSQYAFSASATDSHLSFEGELAVQFAYRFSPHTAFRLGYEVMWLSGIALAPNQIAATDFTSNQAVVDTSAEVFCQGAFGALEMTW